MIYVNNAFSLNMLPGDSYLQIHKLDLDGARLILEENFYQSVVGHEDAARIMQNLLDLPIIYNRKSLVLEPGDALIVGQYSGPRLPEGATTLPEGASFTWWYVEHFEK